MGFVDRMARKKQLKKRARYWTKKASDFEMDASWTLTMEDLELALQMREARDYCRDRAAEAWEELESV